MTIERNMYIFFFLFRYLFLDHVKTVGSYVSKKGKTPLIWDDMLRNIPRSDIQFSGIGEVVEVMVWSYTEDIDRYFLQSFNITTTNQLFQIYCSLQLADVCRPF